jgi:hypothetical protein
MFVLNLKITQMENTLLDRVDDGFNYFLDFRLEEVKEDDKYYIEAFMQYIDVLECKVDKLSKQLK